MRAAVVERALTAIDWDFAAPRAGYVAPPHWYPGTFVPALSDALIQALTPVGGTVFDPYAGIGTAGWSALRNGRSCHVADLNPVAVLVSYTTTSLIALAQSGSPLARSALSDLSRAIGRNDELFGPATPISTGELDEAVHRVCGPAAEIMLDMIVVGPPRWVELSRWIAPDTLQQIERMVQTIGEAKSAYLRLVGLCMLSATARSVSSQHASWGHIADNVQPRSFSVHSLHEATSRWLKRTKSFLNAPVATSGVTITDQKPTSYVHRLDWSAADPLPVERVADLLLTSPPYADAIDYTLAQRLSLYLLGYDDAAISALVSCEIGARRKRFKTTSRSTWSEQLCAALKRQVRWLKPEGAVCLVLPHKDSGRRTGEDDLKVTLEGLGWRLFFERDRSIHQSHTRHSWTSIKKETILAFLPDGFH